MTHRVLCFGGRDYDDRMAIDTALMQLTTSIGQFAIIHGGARGADQLCGEWGERRGRPVIAVRANWDFYAKAAGGIRNSWMLEHCMPTYAVGFPGGPGTSDMAKRCERSGLTLWRPYGS